MSEPPPRPSPTEQHASFQSGVNFNTNPGSSAGTNLRQRPLGRAATFSESPSKFRRNSAISDTVSEARQSIRDSTDDLLFPRAKGIGLGGVGLGRLRNSTGGGGSDKSQHEHDDSHWQSTPLALALLPAVGGLFFQNGSAFVTDATLLILAAIFLNWSVRLPWKWYRSAQEVRHLPPQPILSSDRDIIAEEDEDQEKEDGDDDDEPKEPERNNIDSASEAAIKELHMHEIGALISCFVFPVFGAWLLHGIRDALSRPSEGLVSNYNLTIFLLAAEIRPFAHLLRMVQGRTLYLQRVVTDAAANEDEDEEDREIDHEKIVDLAARLEDLEAHIADKAAATSETATNTNGVVSGQQGGTPSTGQGLGPTAVVLKPEIIAQIITDVRHTFQPELDALNRAVRRYEKKTALMAFTTESRLNQIETQVGDAIALSAAAQRSAADQHQSFAFTLIDWLCAAIVIPVRMGVQLISIPGRMASFCLQKVTNLLSSGKRRRKTNKGKQRQIQTRPTFPALSERRFVTSPPSQGGKASGIRPVKSS